MPDWEAAQKAQMKEQSKTPEPDKTVHTDSLVNASANPLALQPLQESGVTLTDPAGSVAGGNPAGSVAGGDPVDPVAGGDPADPVAGGDPVDPVAGGDPVDPVAGGDSVDPVAGGDPVDPVAGGNPADPVAGEDQAEQVSDKILKERMKKVKEAEKEQRKRAEKAEKERERADDEIEKYRGLVEAAEAQGIMDDTQEKMRALGIAAEVLKEKNREAEEAERAAEASDEADREQKQEEARRKRKEAGIAERVWERRKADFEAEFARVEEVRKARDMARGMVAKGKQEKLNKATEETKILSQTRVDAMRKEQQATVRADAIQKVKEDAKSYPIPIKDKEEGEGEEPQDAFNAALMAAVLQSGGMEVEPKGGEADDRKFDTLADLKNLDQEAPQEGEADADEELKRTREKVHKLRKGNLYKAVIMARLLAPGNLSSEKALKDQKEAAESSSNAGRFSRFFDKGFDVMGKFGKTASAVSGIKALGDKEGYGKSKMAVAISIASDVKALACAIRGIYKKLKALIKKKVEKGVETALTVIGLFSDLSTVVAKIASMTKSIGSLHNMSKMNQTICGIVSDAATLLSQLLGLAGTCDAIDKLRKRKEKLEEDQKNEQENVRMIIGNGDAPDGKDKGGSKEDPPKDKEGAEETAPEGGDKNNKKNKKDKKDEKYKKDNDLTKRAVEKLTDPSVELTEDQRATLASYLARDKVIVKKKLAIVNTSIGLATNILGIISVSMKTWKDSEDLKDMKEEKGNDNKEEAEKTGELADDSTDEEEETTKAERAADISAFSTNVATIASSAVMPLIVTGRDVLSKKGDKPELIKEGLWGALINLGKDEYGLRGIANDLNQGPQGDIGKANAALEQYGKAEKQLDGADVDYSRLFEAENQEKFKKALVAGI